MKHEARVRFVKRRTTSIEIMEEFTQRLSKDSDVARELAHCVGKCHKGGEQKYTASEVPDYQNPSMR
jgi:hypothetical protein